MVACAQVAHYARNGARWGVRTGEVSVDLPVVMARKKKVVEQSRASQERNVAAPPTMRLFRAHARFTGPHTVEVGGETLTAEKIFIDTGQPRDSRHRRPRLGRLPHQRLHHGTRSPPRTPPYSRRRLHRPRVGQMFARFGSRVTVMHSGAQILPQRTPTSPPSCNKFSNARACISF